MKNRVYSKLHDFACSVDDISILLDTYPTISWIEGDSAQVGKAPTIRVGRTWQLVANVDEDRPLSEHIDVMINFIRLKRDSLSKVLESAYGEFTIVCMYRSKADFNFGAYFDQKSLNILSGIGLNLDIDVYFLPKN
ncbi:DUF4279 domain-containing protein [Dyadobacter luticola]|uniref:DUF4279 domain-containing protein n=1 Tax=Dyadobacter luticola TaxID=1979387 RepID=A0A5R9KLQ6_9BACT|nr:DUF4279 domain-containing protein [Dyadobacter luticola]TLU96986.1 DUF4279 domain-containing protein [Dyadobacter luticola]